MAEFKPITTQEEFDSAIKSRIERAEKTTRETVTAEFNGFIAPAEIDKLKAEYQAKIEKLNADHAEQMKKYAGYDERFKAFETEINGYKIRDLKMKAATANKLPMDAIEFIQGEDETAINESAARLVNLTGGNHTFGMTRNTETKADGDAPLRELLAKMNEKRR